MVNHRSAKLAGAAISTVLLCCLWPLTSHSQTANPIKPDVTALCDALQSGRWSEAVQIVQAGAAVTNLDQRERMPLAVLAQCWFHASADPELRLQLLKEFLRRGADPFGSGYSGFSPGNGGAVVEEALLKVDATLADEMLTNRPSAARRTPGGDTALHLAAQAARANVIAHLLGSGFSINQTNNDGLTPLQSVVAVAGSGAFIRTNDMLFGFEARQVKGGAFVVPSPARIAAQLLANGATLDPFSAAGMGMTNQLAALLRTNPMVVDQRDGLGRTPLHYAVLNSQFRTTIQLVKAGADVSVMTTKPLARTRVYRAVAAQSSPLHVACLHANHDLVELLLKASAPVNQADADGNTPLHLASPLGDTGCASLLINARATLDAMNQAGKTPLRVAVESGSTPAIELLIQSGARTEIGLDGETLLHVAARQGGPENLQSGPDYLTGERSSFSIPALLRHGLVVDARDSEGCTPLQRAITALNLTALRQLWTNHADVNVQDNRGNTALHQAAVQYWGAFMPTMQDSYGDYLKTNIPPGRGQWPLPPRKISGISVTGWLLEHGADPNLTNHDGLTPLELVCNQEWGYWEKKSATNRITLLLQAGAKVAKPGFGTLEDCFAKIKSPSPQPFHR